MSNNELFLLQLLVILGASRAVGLLFRRLGQPQVIAEIVTGMALGPTLLGRFFPGTFAALFPSSSLASLEALSQLGLVLFMFLVGLELDVEALKRLGRAAAGVTAGTLLVPMVAGLALGYALFPGFAAPGVNAAEFAFFIAICLSVTAFPVLARILGERGMLRTRVGVVSLSAAAANDVAGFVLVGLATAASRAKSPTDLGMAFLRTFGFVVAMLTVVRPALARIERRFGTLRDLTQTALALLFLAVVASAWVAERVGLHALFGAFLAGLAMPRIRHTIEAIRARIEDLSTLVLLPVFFASTGLRTDMADAMGSHLGWTVLIVATATGAMIVGAFIPARANGFSIRDSLTLGVLANTRGLMELVILKIGRDLGLLPPTIFAMLVVMAVVNTLLTSPLVARLYPRRRVLEDQLSAPSPSPSWRVVACVSHPDSAPSLGRLAAALAGADGGGWALRLLPIEENPGLFPSPEVEGDDAATQLAATADRLGVSLRAVTLPASDRPAAIRDFAEINHADVVLLGLHRPLWGGAQLGGPVASVAQDPRQDVVVFHDRGLMGPKRILLGLGGENDDAARRVAERFARREGVELSVLDATRDGRRIDTLKAAAVGVDLVIVGIGPAWDLPIQRFDVREPRLLAELECSLVAVSGMPSVSLVEKG